VIDDEAIALELIENPLFITGWIMPDGKLLRSESYMHFSLLADIPRYENLIWAHNIAEEREREHSREFSDSYRHESHTPWHDYDSSEWEGFAGSVRQFVFSVAYNDGYTRFYVDKIRNRFNVETTQRVFDKNKVPLLRLVKKYNPEYELECNAVQLYRDFLKENEFEVSDLCEEIEGFYDEVETLVKEMNEDQS